MPKRQYKTSPAVLQFIQKNMRESIVELERRIRWASEREIPSPGDSRLAEEQRRFWSSVKADFEAVRATYLVALRRLEHAEAELGLSSNCLAICARLSASLRDQLASSPRLVVSASLRDQLASSARLVVKAWPARALQRGAEATLVVHAKPRGRWFALVYISVAEDIHGTYHIAAEATMRLFDFEVDLPSSRTEEVLKRYKEEYGATALVGESYDSLDGSEPWFGTTLDVIFPILSWSHVAEDFEVKRVAQELASSASERLPEMEKLCKELVGTDSR